jgi:alkylhydroperoxidase/carboxymuconolactone decarboxylase family protein YurZ
MAFAPAPSLLPIRQDLASLFTTLEQSFTNTNLGPKRWYLVVLAALVGGTEPEFADQLYLHIISQPSYQSSEQRQALVRRLREALVKLVSIVGVCKPLEAILSISKAERPEDRDYAFTRQDWNADAANHERGANWLGKIYAGNTEDTLALFNAHKDFRWISEEITYGLYLSDRQVLDDWDTEVIVLAGIMIQNLKLETRWHIRGALRVGMSKEDVKTVMQCVRKVAEFTDVKLNRIPAVEEVEHEV